MRIKILSILLLGMISVGTASILIKLCNASPIVIATYRMFLSALMVLPVFLLKGLLEAREKKSQIKDFIPLGILISAHFILWIYSLSYTSVASSTVLVTTNPMFVPIFSFLIYKERTNKRLLLGILIAITGSILIALAAKNSGISRNFGNLLALLGAVAVSLYLTIGKRVRSNFSLISYIFFVYSFAGIILLAVAVITRQNLFIHSSKTYLLLFLIALIPQVIGHTAYNWALKYLSASFIAISILGEPIFATIFAFFILKEVPSILEIIGAILIMAGIYFSTRVEAYLNK
ncbi:MAG: DMT family transporter [Caldisericaceae bacterium]